MQSASILITLQKALKEFDSLDAAVLAHSIGTPESINTRKRRALLVEDNSNESELLAGYLRLTGYEVDTAADGLQALIYLSRHLPPDVVLIDMHMPEMDGPETVRSIRGNPDLSSVKVFAVTGKTPAEAGLEIGAAGVDRWFQKPVNPERLVHELNGELKSLTSCV